MPDKTHNTSPPDHVPAYADQSFPLDQRIAAADRAMQQGDAMAAQWASHLKHQYARAMGVTRTQATPTSHETPRQPTQFDGFQDLQDTMAEGGPEAFIERVQNQDNLGVTGQVVADLTDEGRQAATRDQQIDLTQPRGDGSGEPDDVDGSPAPRSQPNPNDPMDEARQQFDNLQQQNAQAAARQSVTGRINRAQEEGRWGDSFAMKMQQATRDADGA